MHFLRVAALVNLVALSTVVLPAHAADMVNDCRVGTYRLSDRSAVDIAPADETTLRWRREDGTSGALKQSPDGAWSSTLGWTGKPDGKRVAFSDCAAGEMTFDGIRGKRIAFDVNETQFKVDGVDLAGRLVMPAGSGSVPVVVLVHGSEDFSGRDFYALQRMFPAAGIGAFVYDKRGTGASRGSYTHDYHVLAKDAVAAMREAKRMAGSRTHRIGYQGTSQGGWVAPLAATLAPVDFVVVGYGLAVSPLEEDRSAIVLDMTRHGFGPDVVRKALEVADATEAIVVSGFRSGFDRLESVRSRYGNEPWFKFVHGNITFFMLQTPEAEVRKQGPVLLAGALPHYDPMPVLQALDTPQLWILAEDDLDAPSAETIRRLRTLTDAGKPIVTTVFPRTEHGIFEYETAADGSRSSTRNADGYFALMSDFILRGRLESRYGSSIIYPTVRMHLP